MNFRHHPDGLIFLGDLQLPLAFFQQQEPSYALPARAIGREYVPGIRHTLSDGSSQWAGELPWKEGDRYLSKKALYAAAWAASIVVTPTEPSPNYVKLYNDLLTEGLNVFLFVRSLSDQNLPIANAYGDFVNALTTPAPSIPALQSCINNLFAAIQGYGLSFSVGQVATMRSLLDRNGFTAIAFPISLG